MTTLADVNRKNREVFGTKDSEVKADPTPSPLAAPKPPVTHDDTCDCKDCAMKRANDAYTPVSGKSIADVQKDNESFYAGEHTGIAQDSNSKDAESYSFRVRAQHPETGQASDHIVHGAVSKSHAESTVRKATGLPIVTSMTSHIDPKAAQSSGPAPRIHQAK